MLISLLLACATEGFDGETVELDVSVSEVYAGQDVYNESQWVDLHVIVENNSDSPAEVLADAELSGSHIYSKRTTVIPPRQQADIRLRSKSTRFDDGAFEVTVSVVGMGLTDTDLSNNVASSQRISFTE